MRCEKQTVWVDEETGAAIVRLVPTDPPKWIVIPATCAAAELADLGKAIIDALVHTREGADLLEFATSVMAEKSVVTIVAGPPTEDGSET